MILFIAALLRKLPIPCQMVIHQPQQRAIRPRKVTNALCLFRANWRPTSRLPLDRPSN